MYMSLYVSSQRFQDCMGQAMHVGLKPVADEVNAMFI